MINPRAHLAAHRVDGASRAKAVYADVTRSHPALTLEVACRAQLACRLPHSGEAARQAITAHGRIAASRDRVGFASGTCEARSIGRVARCRIVRALHPHATRVL